jgi:hypothetical protein
MASSIGDYAENKLLDAVYSGTSYSVTTAYISLHTANPGETGSNEVTGGDYVRKAGSFAAASSGATTTDADLEWTNMPSCTVYAVGVWDTSSSGNFLWGGDLTAQKTVNAGDTFKIATGDLDVTLD